jgi:hypothetical protein
MNETHLTEQLVKKWAPVLDHPDLPKISDPYRKAVTATILENQEKSQRDQGLIFETASYPNVAGNDFSGSNSNLSKYDPVLISMVRRAMPQLIAYDICGVQAMTGPTGLVFSMKSSYANTSVANVSEALFNEANTAYSGTGTHQTMGNPANGANTSPLTAFTFGTGMNTATGELNDAWPQMGFEIAKSEVGVKTRQLKTDYSVELAQDLRAVHNLDAESELANILSTEILSEINREVVRSIYSIAKPGGGTATGEVDLAVSTGDINGRYFAEQWRGLQFMIERDSVRIAKDTRRGKGNFIIVDAETASALASIGVLDYSKNLDPRSSLSQMPDETISTFAGVIGGRIKVYVDPYIELAQNFYCVGYKGASPWDAGMHYCPYVPLQMTKITHENSFQPSIGFRTRYGIAEHPFAGSSYLKTGSNPHTNNYYRISVINNLI